MAKIKVSVIIPNWNGVQLLKTCLTSLQKQTFRNSEVIVVDNGSTDGSVTFIKKNFPKVKIIKLSRNTGFAHAVNLGIKKAIGEMVILVNNDTEIDKDCLGALVSCANEHPEVSFIAAKVLNFYKRGIIDSAGDYITEVGHADNIGRGKKDGEEYSKAGPVFLATGGGCLIKKEAFTKVGFFDEDYFMYFEDVDWCLRAQLQGYKGWYQPKAKIYHIHKATASKFGNFIEYLQFRNMTMTVLKDFPKGLLVHRLNWLRIIWVNLNTIRFFAVKGYFKEALWAQAYIFLNLRKILSKRKTIQSTKKVSDSYIIQNIRQRKLTLFGLFPKGI